MSMYKCLIILICSILLVACASVTPEGLGISQDQWNQYSQAQKEQIVQGYHEVQKLPKQKYRTSRNSVLSVTISGGQALLPPFTHLQSYQPIAFEIKEGDCQIKLPVKPSSQSGQKGTTLKACYKGGTLFLDPSVYLPSQANGSIQFAAMPVWNRGFNYPGVSSSGIVKLTHVNVYIKEH